VAATNLDLVRSIYADWERGDFSSVEWAHPRVEWVMIDGPTPGHRIGSGSASREFGEFLGAWEHLYIEGESFRELDDGRVLALFQFRGRGRSSGVEVVKVGSEGAHVFYFDSGSVVRIDAYWTRGRALAELGLVRQGKPREANG
jgi:ketosteroid isomerase-like protein